MLLSYLSVSVWGYETLAVYNILLYLVLIPPLGNLRIGLKCLEAEAEISL